MPRAGRRAARPGRPGPQSRWAREPAQVPLVEDQVVDEDEAAEAEALADHLLEVLQDVTFPISLHRLIDEAGERVVELDDGAVTDLVELLGGLRPRVFNAVEDVAEAINARLAREARDVVEADEAE